MDIKILGFTQSGCIVHVPAADMKDFDKGYQGSAKLLTEMVNGDHIFETYFTDRTPNTSGANQN